MRSKKLPLQARIRLIGAFLKHAKNQRHSQAAVIAMLPLQPFPFSRLHSVKGKGFAHFVPLTPFPPIYGSSALIMVQKSH